MPIEHGQGNEVQIPKVTFLKDSHAMSTYDRDW
jgi:hypothetical protein